MNELTIQELSNSDLIRSRIFTIRGVQVILSSDLAPLYDVEVKYLHRQVKRNANRFPSDFVLHLSPEETNALRCQNVTSKVGGITRAPFAFTELGVAMLSSVLRSDTAIQVNIRIMRAFVAVRKYLANHKCMPCPVEEKVNRLAEYIEEILSDQNEINEETRNAIMVLQAAVFGDEHAEQERRVFNVQVKGFRQKNDNPTITSRNHEQQSDHPAEVQP